MAKLSKINMDLFPKIMKNINCFHKWLQKINNLVKKNNLDLIEYNTKEKLNLMIILKKNNNLA